MAIDNSHVPYMSFRAYPCCNFNLIAMMISLLSDGAETLSQWHHSTQPSNRHDKCLINVSYVKTLSKHRPITSQSPQEQT